MKDLDIAAPFRQLFERRLWPVAVLLLAALVAVPVLLAGSSREEASPSPTTPVATADLTATQPVVSLVDLGKVEHRRKVLGSPKNPFRPAIAAKKAAAAPGASVAVASGGAGSPAPSAPSGGGASVGGSSSGSGGGYPATPTVPVYGAPAPASTGPTTTLYATVIRFGEVGGERSLRAPKRLTTLPDGGTSKVLYLGLLRDRTTAVFLLDEGIGVSGDGRCEPEGEDCQTLRLKPGETALLEVPGEGGPTEYRLDVVRILRQRTADSAVAARYRELVAKGGREALGERVGRVGRYRYSASTGLLRVISKAEWLKDVARAQARAARAR